MKRSIIAMLLAAIVTGCGQAPKEEPKPQQEIRVKTVPVMLTGKGYNLNYSGTIEASQVIPLSFRTVGTVETVFIEVGDPVQKGQVLATLDNAELQNIYDAAMAKYRQAEDAYQRLKQVYDQGSLPEIKWVEMQTNLEQARSSLELSRNNLEKCTLVSPVDGIVGRKNIEPGQSSVTLTSPPVEIVRIEKVLVKISVPENEINNIPEGQLASISVSALGGKNFEGEVTNISPVAELMSRTYTVKITVVNPGKNLKPGMVCDVRLRLEETGNVLVVPVRAVTRDSSGSPYVFVVSTDQKTVKKQEIKVGRYLENGIEVIGGLAEGQIVVCEGVEKLSDNSKITL